MLAVVNGRPAIAYRGTNSSLTYVRATDASGTSWGTPVNIAGAGVNPDISLDVVNGHPAIAFFDDTDDDLKYVRADDAEGSSWGAPICIASNGSVGQDASLTVARGLPAISYRGSASLKYVQAFDAAGGSWGTPMVIDSFPFNEYTSLAEVNGRAAISYYSAFLGLRYARFELQPVSLNWIAVEP